MSSKTAAALWAELDRLEAILEKAAFEIPKIKTLLAKLEDGKNQPSDKGRGGR